MYILYENLPMPSLSHRLHHHKKWILLNNKYHHRIYSSLLTTLNREFVDGFEKFQKITVLRLTYDRRNLTCCTLHRKLTLCCLQDTVLLLCVCDC